MQVIILSGKKIKIGIITFLVLAIGISLSLIHYINNQKAITAYNNDYDVIADLEKENSRLKGALESIIPNEQKVIYENPYRLWMDKPPSYHTYDLQQIIESGKDINFEITYNNQEYLRPTYDSNWKGFFFRGWLSLPQKISDAYHNLYVYYGGASNIFDFEGELGFHENTVADYHRNINFLVYNFNVVNVKMLDHQIVLIGRPARKGAQIIAVDVNDVLPKDINSKEFLFQLSTPKGYEMDYLYGNYGRSEYLKELMEEEAVQTLAIITGNKSTYVELKKENQIIKMELSNYIPLEDDIVITDQECRNSFNTDILTQITDITDINKVIENGREINFSVKYESLPYRRPIYDPIWEKNVKKGWAYVPTKICQAMHKLFILPNDEKERIELLETLAFHDEITPINFNELGLLVYNFIPTQVMVFNHQIVIVGIPQRTGAVIITLNKNNLMQDANYLIQLATPDFNEVDYEVMITN